MMDKYLDFSNFKTFSIKDRKSKVDVKDFSRPVIPEASIGDLFESLPDVLAGRTLRRVIDAAGRAYSEKKGILWAMGAHVIKCGLNPVLIDLIGNGVISALAVNGACLIHDFEIAFFGKTSEDVAESIQEGEFGMARETGELLNKAINDGIRDGLGLGEAVGRWILTQKPDFLKYSLLASAVAAGIPVTAHVAIGTDIIHMHPSADGACLGEGSFRDFRRFASVCTTLNKGGIYFNAGSAVIMPEVFLKAVSLVINLGYELKDFVTLNIDFIRHYRPLQNVVKRPVLGRGEGYHLTGHHEILIPLLAAGIKRRISAKVSES